MTSPTQELPRVGIPLPRFGRQPKTDLLPEGATVEETADPSRGPLPDPESPNLPRDPTDPDAGRALPPVPSLEAPTPTRTSFRAGGDPKTAGEVIAGALGILCALAFTWAARRGRIFRQPTQRQLDDVSMPLGAIAARHLPTDMIGPDVIDATKAVKAAHSYVLDGPMFTRPHTEPTGDELP